MAITDVMSYLANKLAMRKKPPQQGFCGVEQKTETSTNGNYILSHKYIHIYSNYKHSAPTFLFAQLPQKCVHLIKEY